MMRLPSHASRPEQGRNPSSESLSRVLPRLPERLRLSSFVHLAIRNDLGIEVRSRLQSKTFVKMLGQSHLLNFDDR